MVNAAASQDEAGRSGVFVPVSLLISGLVYLHLTNPYGHTPERLWLATAICLMGGAPMITWLRDPDQTGMPVFQMHCLFYVLTFGFAGFFADNSTLKRFVEEPAMMAAQLATLLALVGLMGGFYCSRTIMEQRISTIRSPIPLRPSDQTAVALVGYPILTLLMWSVQYFEVPYMSQILGSVQRFCFFFLSAGLLTGSLTGVGRWAYLGLYLPLVLFVGVSAGHLAGFVVTIVLLVLLYVSLMRRVAWWPLLVAGAVFILLQPVKGDYRRLVWGEGVELGLVGGVRAFAGMGMEEFVRDAPDERVGSVTEAFEQTVRRVNHLHVTGAVIRDTPTYHPFQYGASYLPLVTKWIPRMIWPEKPEERLGNEWARRYGYLGSDDTATSFNLPWLPEAFMNFGWWGILWIHIIIGCGFRMLHRALLDQPRDQAGFAFGLTLCGSLIFVESNLSLMFGQFIITLISLVAFGALVRWWMMRIHSETDMVDLLVGQANADERCER